MKQLLFFATKDDLVPLLGAVDHALPIKYVLMGNWNTRTEETFARGEMIPKLGWATSESAIACDSYLVVPKDQPINIRIVPAIDGSRRFLIDQLINPDSVTFTPGGLWGDDVLLHGRLATASDTALARALMKRFSEEIRQRFRKQDAYWVGTHAEAIQRAGRRLTISAGSPVEFDLASAP